MKITVLSGSPKGEDSVTYQYVRYVRKHFPAIEFTVRHIGQDIRKIEADTSTYGGIIADIQAADGVVWAFPVYHLSVPSQLKRFIELAFERSPDAFRGKYATALTTSVHFYDHTAHNYVNGISCDLGMRYVDGFSAEMDDLMKEAKREQLLKYFALFIDAIESKRPTEVRFPPVPQGAPEYSSSALPETLAQLGARIALVTDATEEDVSLQRMIATFKAYAGDVDVINLHSVKISGGCLGCIRCGYDNKCVYQDDYKAAYERVMSADCIVYAGRIHDRSLSSRFKMYFDRSFFMGHTHSTGLKQIGYIVSGPLSALPDLRQELEARAGMGNSNLAMFVTDEGDSVENTSTLLGELARRLRQGSSEGIYRPESFLGVGGRLVFRDLVYRMSGVFGADYRFYKMYRLFDYPQKDLKNRLVNFGMRQLMRVPQVRKEFYSRIRSEMAGSYRKIVGE
ncbi:NAD(P)H-dependent oxidoreductase [Methanocella sp. MCL-LM]|uniref:NAD(P)H-dependent oxidoreductase n=1 Tax=Methanocella sp. MCL-LM TaxID=3412035 RepID=UPI003C77F4DE